jgi:APA family basic amino acid/polyamine antiporter
VLRRTEPDRARPFRVPAVKVIAPAALVLSLCLMAQLSWLTWLRFVLWMALGLVIYFAYSRKASALAGG